MLFMWMTWLLEKKYWLFDVDNLHLGKFVGIEGNFRVGLVNVKSRRDVLINYEVNYQKSQRIQGLLSFSWWFIIQWLIFVSLN